MQPKLNQDEESTCLLRCAAVAMMLGPGAAMGFYSAMAGFYIAMFDRPDFFIEMAAAMLCPGALVSLLQYQFDSYFDRLLSTNLAFFVRVILLQIVLAGAAMAWMVRPQCRETVLTVGALLGFLSFSIISSSTQMIAAMDPQLTVYSTIGRMVGSVLPVAVFFVLDFTPESPMAAFRTAISTVPWICAACCCFLVYLHVSTDIFQKSYDRLSDDLWHVPADLSLAERYEAMPDDERLPRQGSILPQSSESAPLLQHIQSIPSWVWVWCAYTGLSTTMAVSAFSGIGFLGDASVAQSLSVAKLVTDFSGVFLSMPLPQFPSFKQAPWHTVLAVAGISCVCLWLTLVYQMFHHACGSCLLQVVWISFYLIHSTMQSHISVTIGSFVSVRDRKRVLRTNVACQNVGLVSGVSMTFSILMPMLTHSSSEVSLLSYTS